MNVALPPELEKRVHESLDRGEFANPDEFFRQAAELLLEVRHSDGTPIPWMRAGTDVSRLSSKRPKQSGEATEMTELTGKK